MWIMVLTVAAIHISMVLGESNSPLILEHIYKHDF
jgi:hypothetical protein